MRRVTALAGVTAILLAGLTAVAGPAQAAPAVGTCWDYPFSVTERISTDAPAVPCEGPHTAETFFVGPVSDRLGTPSKASVNARLAATAPCTVAAMNAYLGLAGRSLPSRFTVVPLLPTDAQWAAGERWVRCDVLLQSGLQAERVAGPMTAVAAGLAPAALDFCTPGTPSAKNTAAVPCTGRRNWIKVLEQTLGGPTARFPGTSAIQRRSATICQRVAKKYAGNVQFPGWWRINPTESGWRDGKRTLQCFVPYPQYQQELAQNAPAAPAG
jgi:hypothetical protein